MKLAYWAKTHSLLAHTTRESYSSWFRSNENELSNGVLHHEILQRVTLLITSYCRLCENKYNIVKRFILYKVSRWSSGMSVRRINHR